MIGVNRIRNIFLIIFVVWVGFNNSSYCQNVTIKVTDNNKIPLFGASVKMSLANDSLKFFSGTTNEAGEKIFEKIIEGLYIVKFSYIGYQNLEKTILVQPQSRSFEFILKENSLSLGGLTITDTKPLIRQEDDKMIIDPKPLVGISSNTLEVLESTPGLFVDYEAGVYLNSATPAVIFVNGREQKLGKQDIITLLKNLPPGSIEKIEVIRTPSTKYDAASSGGIINIILKKGMKIGRFGNMNIGMNQGLYGNRFAGFSLNNSGEKSTYYINANFNRNDFQEDLNTIRYFGADTTLFQYSISRQQSNQAYVGYGYGYDISTKTNFSYDGRIGFTSKKSDALSLSSVENAEFLELLKSENLIANQYSTWSISQDFGLNYKIDSLGSDWDNKLSYNLITNNSEQDYSNTYSFPVYALQSGFGDNQQQRQFFLFQSDLTRLLPYKIKLETGIKSTWQYFSSEADYFKISGNSSLFDSSRTNSFTYNEAINAAYIQASKTIWGNFLLKTGCRLEYTYMNGKQTVPTNTSFLVERPDVFPYVYLSRSIIKMLGIELKSYLIYRRTINRPDYQNLNPYKKYIDPFLYEAGNPDLKPQFTDNIEINISYEDMPILAFGKNYTKDIFSSVVYSDSSNANIAVITYDNLGSSEETYIKTMVGIPPGGKYFFAMGAQYNLSDYNGFYQGNPLTYKRGSWRLFTFHSLSLFSQTKLTMSGFMMVNGQQGFYELENFGSLNFGITQTLMNKNLMITINARDVLKTMLTKFTLSQGSVQTNGDRYSDNRRIGINIRYNFGLGKKHDKKGIKGYDEEDGM